MENKLKKPDSYLLTNTVRHWDEHYHYAFDQAFYHLAFPQINRRFYVTPSHYIGRVFNLYYFILMLNYLLKLFT